jgi:hypothetical protein
LPKGDALVQLGMRIGLAHQDEVEALGQSQGTPAILILLREGFRVANRLRLGYGGYPLAPRR